MIPQQHTAHGGLREWQAKRENDGNKTLRASSSKSCMEKNRKHNIAGHKVCEKKYKKVTTTSEAI